MLSDLLTHDILHTLVQLVFFAMIAALFLQMILSWLTLMFLPPDHPILRFFTRLTAPVLEPLRKRIPSMSLGMMDLSYTIAFIFAWWAISVVGLLVLSAMPQGW
jgi:uncharacterized protein YggT (Ycf19 family)